MAKTTKPIAFTSVLTKIPDHFGWHFVPVPAKIGERIEKRDGTRRIVCTLNNAESFQCALIPYDGDFMIVVNKTKRDRLRIRQGDSVSVEVVQDESKYGLPMPEEFREVLDQDPEGDKLFHKLTAGKQRSMLYYIGKIKDIDQRIHAGLVIIDHLRENDGKVIGKQLYEELKRPMF